MSNKHTPHLMILPEDAAYDDIREKEIPTNLLDRVFVLGANPESENLKSNVKGGFEAIGLNLGSDCVNNTNLTWNHQTINHNQAELSRMRAKVGLFLFN
jgi:hypothetical protein